MKKQITVDEWVKMFRDIGLEDAAMKKWHHLFETRHPEAHESFLAWLGLPAQEIERIRSKYRQ